MAWLPCRWQRQPCSSRRVPVTVSLRRALSLPAGPQPPAARASTAQASAAQASAAQASAAQAGALTSNGCAGQPPVSPLPVWARSGFSPADLAMPHVMGEAANIVAILWAPRDALRRGPGYAPKSPWLCAIAAA
jgi:hypothetical protein